MDRVIFNDLLTRYDNEETARREFYSYVYGSAKRYLLSRYGDISDIEDILNSFVLYFVEHRPKSYVYAPFKYLIQSVNNYIASHHEIFKKYVPLEIVKEPQYEQSFTELEDSDTKKSLKRILKDELVETLVYRHCVDGESEKNLANELGLSYANARAKISRAIKKLKKYFTECNKN